MKRNIMLLLLLLVYGFGTFYAKTNIYDQQPGVLVDLEDEQTRNNEKLITSQILSDQLDRVYTIFENNLAVDKDDKRYEMASMDFLDNVTDILDHLEIIVLLIQPKPIRERRSYTEIPYELKISCSFDKFGKFITELERNDRLIKVSEFKLDNGVERVSTLRSKQKLLDLEVEMEICTLTLKKISG